jgi:DNA-binding MarR family transcriptional regulator/proteasome lid subunit RPN8/RPN11
MLLEILEEKRKKNPLNVKELLRKVAKSPLWLQPAEPKRRPLIIDKLCLMELGLSEIQTEILLALWEAGGQLPIWGDGTADLCHELKMTSPTIKKHVKGLEELGFVKVIFDGKSEVVIASSPKETYKIIEETLNTRFQILLELFRLKQEEFEERARLHKEFIPKKYKLTTKVRRSLDELKKERRIVCGFVVGKIENEGQNIIVEDFVPIKTKSGPKIHFDPVWKDYHRVKKELIANKKWIIGEFHTHPDGNLELHPKDLEKMKMLCRGMWWVIGEESACYLFTKENNELKLIEIREY